MSGPLGFDLAAVQVDGFNDAWCRMIMQRRSGKPDSNRENQQTVQGIIGHILLSALCDMSKELTILVRVEVADPVAETAKFLAFDTEISSSQLSSEYGAYPV